MPAKKKANPTRVNLDSGEITQPEMKTSEIRDLIDFISKSGLNEVNIETKELKLSVKREPDQKVFKSTPVVTQAAAPALSAATPAPPAAAVRPVSTSAPAPRGEPQKKTVKAVQQPAESLPTAMELPAKGKVPAAKVVPRRSRGRRALRTRSGRSGEQAGSAECAAGAKRAASWRIDPAASVPSNSPPAERPPASAPACLPRQMMADLRGAGRAAGAAISPPTQPSPVQGEGGSF